MTPLRASMLAHSFVVTTVGAVSTYSGIHVIDLASGDDRLIGRPTGSSLDWSPDGTRLAFVEASAGWRWGFIHVMNADGSGDHLIHTGTEGRDMSPSWSPDGKRLAFATKSGNPNVTVSRLYRSSVSVRRPRRVASNAPGQ